MPCSFKWCHLPAEYRINGTSSSRLACEWHAVEHYREMCAPAFKSMFDRVRLAHIETERTTEKMAEQQHEMWRRRFVANLGKSVTPPELPKDDL